MTIRVLSLGAGVQSSTLLLMSCRGDLPRLDAAIFADTGWEPRAVYEHLDWLVAEAGRHGIPVHRVSCGANIRDTHIRALVNHGRMPLFVRNPDGSDGMLNRQCTSRFKVRPIERFIKRELLGIAPGVVAATGLVDQWFGISADETRRTRLSRDRWKRHVYPLCNLPERYLPREFRRDDCVRWLRAHYPERIIPRSACIGCPYHSDNEWRAIRADAEAWEDACDADDLIRAAALARGTAYLHRSRVPLRDVDLDTPEERGQLTLGFECLGNCFT